MLDDTMFIGHIVDMAKRAQRMIDGVERGEFEKDEKLQLALVHALQVIGEAAWRTSEGFQTNHPNVPWRKIAAFRHRVVHEYFAVDYDIVWQIAKFELQPLIDRLEPLLPPDSQAKST
jgi:uncharacterized protein with HEPN domain